jgi:hypothetical protein
MLLECQSNRATREPAPRQKQKRLVLPTFANKSTLIPLEQ